MDATGFGYDFGEFEKKAIIHSVNLIMEFVKNM